MKNRGLIMFAIIILSILVISLVAFLILALQGNYHFGFKSISTELVHDEIYENSFETIEIDSDASDIEIRHSDDTKVRVVIYGYKERTDVKNDGKVLKINAQSKKCFGFCFNIKISKITVYLPKDYAGKIKATNKFGDISIGEYRFADITVKEDCGDVKIDGAKDVDIENKYGNIDLGSVETAKIKESCGDVKIINVKDAKIENNLGNIKIDNVTSHIDIVEDCGDVKIDNLNLTQDSSIKNSLGNIKIGLTNEIYFDASVSLGDIKINNNYRNSSVTITIKNSCGDIEVQN